LDHRRRYLCLSSIFAAQREELRGTVRCLLGSGLLVSWPLHHKKMPAPSKAIRIMPTMVNRRIQRIASLAMRRKIASNTTPAMMEIVVKSMGQLLGTDRWAVSRRQ
jgi:hypothetical protein